MIHHNSPQLTTWLSNANNERGFLAKAGTQAQHGTASALVQNQVA